MTLRNCFSPFALKAEYVFAFVPCMLICPETSLPWYYGCKFGTVYIIVFWETEVEFVSCVKGIALWQLGNEVIKKKYTNAAYMRIC